jgi:hypothetical protein
MEDVLARIKLLPLFLRLAFAELSDGTEIPRTIQSYLDHLVSLPYIQEYFVEVPDSLDGSQVVHEWVLPILTDPAAHAERSLILVILGVLWQEGRELMAPPLDDPYHNTWAIWFEGAFNIVHQFLLATDSRPNADDILKDLKLTIFLADLMSKAGAQGQEPIPLRTEVQLPSNPLSEDTEALLRVPTDLASIHGLGFDGELDPDLAESVITARRYHHTQGNLRNTPTADQALYISQKEEIRNNTGNLLAALLRVRLCYDDTRIDRASRTIP